MAHCPRGCSHALGRTDLIAAPTTAPLRLRPRLKLRTHHLRQRITYSTGASSGESSHHPLTRTPAANSQSIAEFINRRDVPSPHNGIIRILTLNSPRNKNAFSRQLVAELLSEVESFQQHNAQAERARKGKETVQELDKSGTEEIAARSATRKTIRAVILASDVDKVFCAGADLKERMKMSYDETQSFLTKLRMTLDRISQSNVPILAAVSGFALGGGLELALAAHFRVFGRKAVVGLPETRLAIVPGAGGLYRLRDMIGPTRARDMILTGRRVGAEEAYQLGLCQRLAKPLEKDADNEDRQAVIQVAVEMATEISKGAPRATASAMDFFRKRNNDADTALEEEAYASVLSSSDRNEALQAFTEKREPVFRGT